MSSSQSVSDKVTYRAVWGQLKIKKGRLAEIMTWAKLSHANVGILIADFPPGLVSGYLVMWARGGAGHCFFKGFWVRIEF